MDKSGTGQTRRSFLLKAAGVASTAVFGSPALVNAASGADSQANDDAQPIHVDFKEVSPIDPGLYGRYLNIIGNGAPFTEQDFQLYQQQLGRLKLVRIWGTKHIDYAAQIADEALMVPQSHLRKPESGGPQSSSADENLRDGEAFMDLHGLVHGEVSESECVAMAERYLGEIKAKYPFVTHIEPFNELAGAGLNLPVGMTVAGAYYKGFRVAYLAANRLNKKNAYAKPILVGGTACAPIQFTNNYMKTFLDCYAQDKDPSKRLGFLSVHYYQDKDRERVLNLRRDAEALLSSRGIPPVPLIMSEIGLNPGAKPYDGNPKYALRWAAGSLAHAYQAAEQNVIPMHWVYPRKEDRHCMVSPASPAPALLPKGNAIKLAQMLKKHHAKSSIAIDGAAGSGVYSVATFDESGVAILLFNYDPEGESTRSVALNLLNTNTLPSRTGRVTEYLLDWNNGNYFANKDAWQMQPVDGGMKPLHALNDRVVTLKGNAAYMLLISFAA